MKNVIYLKKGEVYFHAAFLDKELTVPSIDTYIFIGFDEEYGYLFQDAKDETKQICYDLKNVDCIYDRVSLSKWLMEDHSPRHPKQTEYIYKIK
jgi:hypothetical protein